MLSRTALPMLRAMPIATRVIARSTVIATTKRTIHISYIRSRDTKATFATVAPETTPQKPASPIADDKTVAKVEGKPLESTDSIKDKRDFYWSHPVYTREEYEAVQVRPIRHCLTRSRIVRRIHFLNMLPSQLSNSFAQDSISPPDINIPLVSSS